MRSFRLMALLAMCLMLLAAPVQAKTTITFWHGMGGELGEITDEMIKEFNASQDKYEVKGVYKGNYDEAMTAAIAAFRAKQHPNLIQIFEVGTASMMAAKGAIRPVYEIMEAAGTPVDTSKLLGSVASYYSSTDGKLIAMPFNASTTVLYYNKDAVKKAGGDPDHFPTTWPEVAELAKKIKESGACKYGLTSGWQSWVQLESFSAWHNVPFATNNNGYDGLDTKLLFNSPLHVKHIDFLSKLQKDGVMVYVGRKSEAINAFTSGEAGILMNSSGSYAAVKAGAKFQWGVALLPYWPDVKGAPQNTVIGGAAIWAMAGHSKDAEKGAAAFLNYLLKPEVQARFHQLTGYVPVPGRLRTDQAAGLLRQEPRHRHRREGPFRQEAHHQLAGPAPRQLRPDPQHHRRRARSRLGRQEDRQAGARRRCGTRQRRTGAFRQGQQEVNADPQHRGRGPAGPPPVSSGASFAAFPPQGTPPTRTRSRYAGWTLRVQGQETPASSPPLPAAPARHHGGVFLLPRR